MKLEPCRHGLREAAQHDLALQLARFAGNKNHPLVIAAQASGRLAQMQASAAEERIFSGQATVAQQAEGLKRQRQFG
ncbi:MAG: hypothetical protein INF43_03515 [Alphaproteobacteria bacterium]|jgi:hypothetical protein|nr:hypothetical protein [Alphaproteobacteria bacterium]